MAEEKKREDSPRRNKVKNLPSPDGRGRLEQQSIAASGKAGYQSRRALTGIGDSGVSGSRTGKPLPCRPRLGGFLRLPAAVSALRAVLLIRSSLVGEAADNFFNVRTVGDGLVLAEKSTPA